MPKDMTNKDMTDKEMTNKDKISKVIVAIDVDSPERALDIAARLQGTGCWLKVGLELYALAGLSFVDRLKEMGFSIFLDLKLHDIPTTVERTLRVLTASGADMINVHCAGGYEMMARAAEVCHRAGKMLIGVTVLTSLKEKELLTIGVEAPVEEQVVRLAALARQAGLDGVVASAQEAARLRSLYSDFLLVTPGIRPAGSETHDQARVLTPQAALDAGSSYLVVGRPIVQAADPRQALLNLYR